MKNNYLKTNLSIFLSSNLFKALLFLLIIMSFFTVLNCNDVNIIESISLVFSDYIFLSLCILPIFLFLTNYVYTLFDKDIFIITRFKTKDKYLIELFKNIIFSTTIIFLIILSIVIIMENIFNAQGYHILYNEKTNCYNYFYLIFTILKFYLFSILFSLINVLLIKNFNSKIVIFLNFIFFALVFYCGFSVIEVNSLRNIPLFIGNYLVNNGIYNTFLLELFANIIIYLITFVVFIILLFYTKKRKKDIS